MKGSACSRRNLSSSIGCQLDAITFVFRRVISFGKRSEIAEPLDELIAQCERAARAVRPFAQRKRVPRRARVCIDAFLADSQKMSDLVRGIGILRQHWLLHEAHNVQGVALALSLMLEIGHGDNRLLLVCHRSIRATRRIHAQGLTCLRYRRTSLVPPAAEGPPLSWGLIGVFDDWYNLQRKAP